MKMDIPFLHQDFLELLSDKKLSHFVKQFTLDRSNFLHLRSFILWMSIFNLLRSSTWFYFINIIIATIPK
jgi:hypothetical protein